jgi:hypothetical protein
MNENIFKILSEILNLRIFINNILKNVKKLPINFK